MAWTNYFASAADADAEAASIVPLTNWPNFSDTQRLAACLEASYRVDKHWAYQGCKVDPTQQNEFPRFPAGHLGRPTPGVWPTSGLNLGCGPNPNGLVVWDWDDVNDVPIVPEAVLRAVIIEADAILGGDRHTVQRQAREGLTGQNLGQAAEQYDAAFAARNPLLCQRAAQQVQMYRLAFLSNV
jgi:hypothetical protein